MASKLANLFIFLGLSLIFLSLFIFLRLFSPIITKEVTYQTQRITGQKNSGGAAITTPVDTQFALVIDKIFINVPIISGVDPNDPAQYQQALTQGVAQALGSSTPDQTGNLFLFSHSSADLNLALRFNSIFYLLNKLESGDKLTVYYHDQPYIYQVEGKKIVSPTEVNYLDNTRTGHTLTLMTCWPPGTDKQRLLVFAKSL